MSKNKRQTDVHAPLALHMMRACADDAAIRRITSILVASGAQKEMLAALVQEIVTCSADEAWRQLGPTKTPVGILYLENRR